MVKPLYGSKGEGIVELSDGRHAADRLAELLERNRALYLQQVVRSASGTGAPRSDLRLFVIGDRTVAAISRIATAGEHRTNIHQGGTACAYQPDPQLARLAVAATRAVGLCYAGVDVIQSAGGPCVLEVNGTPFWEGIQRATGRDMAEPIVQHALALAAARRARAQPARHHASAP